MNPPGPLPRVNLSWQTASGEKVSGTYCLQLAGEHGSALVTADNPPPPQSLDAQGYSSINRLEVGTTALLQPCLLESCTAEP